MSYGNYPNTKNIKKILVIKLRHLGDVLLTTTVFSNLKRYIKDAQIDAFIYEDCLEILKNNPDINKIFTYDKKIKKLFFLKRLKKNLNY